MWDIVKVAAYCYVIITDKGTVTTSNTYTMLYNGMK